MKHRPKAIQVNGVAMFRCRRCRMLWSPSLSDTVADTKCPGRSK